MSRPAAAPATAAAKSPEKRAVLATPHQGDRSWGKRWLERESFQVSEAASTEEVLRLVEEDSPDVVLIAWSMLKQIANQLPARADLLASIVALCANTKELDAAIELGCADGVIRPIAWQLVGRRAARLVDLNRAQSQLQKISRQLVREQAHAVEKAREFRLAGDRDALTGLVTEPVFVRLLRSTLSVAKRHHRSVGLFQINVDHFRVVNDTVGREGGDEVLLVIADRITRWAEARRPAPTARTGPRTSTLGRLAGDGFALSVTNLPEAACVEAAQSLVDLFKRPIVINDVKIYVSVRIGVATSATADYQAETMVRHAEVALTQAKRRGGGIHKLYRESMPRISSRFLQVDSALREALENGQLHVYYQPLVMTEDQSIFGAEALLRWHHPEHGWIAPAEFVDIAEETGAMVQVGEYVLRTACRQAKQWIDEGLPPIRIAVNVSLCQMHRGNLPRLVAQVLEETGLPPELLELELSERGGLRHDPQNLEQMEQLKRLGLRLAVDDFGTGESAISYLRQFPLDTLKVDRSFVLGALDNSNDAILGSAMVAMAQRLQLEVIAEGVEDLSQIATLRDWGCERFQGFIVSPAVSPAEFGVLLGKVQ